MGIAAALIVAGAVAYVGANFLMAAILLVDKGLLVPVLMPVVLPEKAAALVARIPVARVLVAEPA